MDKTLNLRYLAPTPAPSSRGNEVQVLYDGQLVVHTVVTDGAAVHLLTAQGKDRKVYSAVGLDVRIVHGKGKLALDGSGHSTAGKKTIEVLPGGSFTIHANPFCVVKAVPKGGIYPSGNNENGVLR